MAYLPLEIAEGEFKNLGSSFHARLGPLPSVEGFKAIYEDYKKAFPRADHYAYAYRKEGLSKSSDDGEPAGSAGRPLLSLLEQKEIDGYVIVARYFGGSKLGIPRLRRAFLSAAEEAIAKARFGVEADAYAYHVELDYETYQILLNHAKRHHFSIEVESFDAKVKAKISSRDILTKAMEELGFPNLLPEPETVRIILEEKP